MRAPNLVDTFRGTRTKKRARGANFVEGHRQNFNYVKIQTWEFRESVAFFLSQILIHHILGIVSAVTLGINTSQTFSIYSAAAPVLLSLTKGSLKTNCYMTFLVYTLRALLPP